MGLFCQFMNFLSPLNVKCSTKTNIVLPNKAAPDFRKHISSHSTCRWLSHTAFMLWLLLDSMQQYASLFQTVALGMCWGDWEGINFVGLNCCSLHCFGHTALPLRSVHVMFQNNKWLKMFSRDRAKWHERLVAYRLHVYKSHKSHKMQVYALIPTTWWTDKNNLTDKWIPIPKSPLLHIQKSINWLYNEFHARISRMGLKTPGNSIYVNMQIFMLHMSLHWTLTKGHMLPEASLYSEGYVIKHSSKIAMPNVGQIIMYIEQRHCKNPCASNGIACCEYFEENWPCTIWI